VIDIIGKFLTPVLLISLALLIIKGIISPIGDINTNISSNDLFVNGITQGYQTMDALGLGGIVALLMTSFITKGYSDKKEVISLTIKASLVAGAGLTVVYGGLTYLGATASNLFDSNISQTTLLINITNALLGNTGIVILGVIVAFACLTTAIGLTSVTSKYFEDVTNKKLKYEHIVIFICGFSAIVSNFGVDKIIQIAAPILTVIYPVTIVLVVMSCLRKIFVKNCTFRGAAYATLLVSLLTVIDSLGISIGIVNKLPLAQFGFNWVVPAIIGGALFTICSKKDNMIKSNNINKAS
ncbi:MAG: branched-chain amino acid transport system II carrier protein, partial [Paraclostridium sp.]